MFKQKTLESYKEGSYVTEGNQIVSCLRYRKINYLEVVGYSDIMILLVVLTLVSQRSDTSSCLMVELYLRQV